MSASMFRTEGLEKSFGGVTAAADISLSIEEAERVAIIGSNGAGKTTFVNMVTGYLSPSAGRILFDGEDITGEAPRRTARRGIRRSFQVPQLFRELTVMENIVMALVAGEDGRPRFGASLPGDRLQRARDVLERFGLRESADQVVGTLPQGIRKQIDIAMTAVGTPRMVLLDEPTSGVSADEKLQMMDRILGPLGQSGATILFIEHDMDIVRRYAARTVAFYEGRILTDGPTDEVLREGEVRRYVIGDVHA